MEARGRGGRGRRFKNRHRNGKIPKFIKNKLFPEWDGYDKHISPVPNDGRCNKVGIFKISTYLCNSKFVVFGMCKPK